MTTPLETAKAKLASRRADSLGDILAFEEILQSLDGKWRILPVDERAIGMAAGELSTDSREDRRRLSVALKRLDSEAELRRQYGTAEEREATVRRLESQQADYARAKQFADESIAGILRALAVEEGKLAAIRQRRQATVQARQSLLSLARTKPWLHRMSQASSLPKPEELAALEQQSLQFRDFLRSKEQLQKDPAILARIYPDLVTERDALKRSLFGWAFDPYQSPPLRAPDRPAKGWVIDGERLAIARQAITAELVKIESQIAEIGAAWRGELADGDLLEQWVEHGLQGLVGNADAT